MFFNFLSRGAAAPPTAADKENVDPHPLDALADLAEEHEAHDDGEPQEKDEDDLPDGEEEVHEHVAGPSVYETEGAILAHAFGDAEADDTGADAHHVDDTPSEKDVDAAGTQGNEDGEEHHNGDEGEQLAATAEVNQVTHPDGIEPTYSRTGKCILDGLGVDSANFEKWQKAKPHSTKYLQQPFTGKRGARGAGARTRKSTVVEAWSRYFPHALLNLIVTATNEAVIELSQAESARRVPPARRPLDPQPPTAADAIDADARPHSGHREAS
ncbi:hypothetical protein NFJ02_03g104250 [Pycnococcus provasolii]